MIDPGVLKVATAKALASSSTISEVAKKITEAIEAERLIQSMGKARSKMEQNNVAELTAVDVEALSQQIESKKNSLIAGLTKEQVWQGIDIFVSLALKVVASHPAGAAASVIIPILLDAFSNEQ